MKKKPNPKFTKVLIFLGVLLNVVSIVLIVLSFVGNDSNAKNARQIAGELSIVMPPVENTFPEERTNNNMPMFALHGDSFIGTVEIPVYDTFLPVHASWDKLKISRFPCRYTGSVYNGTLVIGGSDGEGQFDFMKFITGGDVVYITEMTGKRYSYVVAHIERTDDVSTENLTNGESDLVLFARNTYALDYTVVRCVFKGSK